MNAPTPTIVNFRQIATTLRQRWWLVAAPLALCSLVSLAYALARKNTWEATQAIYVRDEAGAGGRPKRVGSFEDAESMKTAQETMLEIAKNRQVVEAALAAVGPERERRASGKFPTPDELEKLQGAIRLVPPKGAELGRTEILYLSVRDQERTRAIALATAVCDQLELRLQELRAKKAQSIIDELERTQTLAQAELEAATTRLQALETEVGRDLGELRVLNEAGAGESNLRSALNQIKGELRQAETLRRENLELQRFLVAARGEPEAIVAAPNRLLESQPALKRLKEGLVDAQLRTAQTSAQMTEQHPKVQAALLAEELVRRDLHNELEIALRGLNTDIRVNDAQIAALQAQQADVTARLDRLAGLRARYANLVTDVKQRNEILEKSKKELADAKASWAAATSVSLLSRLDPPQTGNYPVGPGRTTIVLGGTFGGLLIGVGLVFLVTPLGAFRGRRWSDYLGFGRRATDLKRVTDAAQREIPAGAGLPARRSEDRPPIPHDAPQRPNDEQAEARIVTGSSPQREAPLPETPATEPCAAPTATSTPDWPAVVCRAMNEASLMSAAPAVVLNEERPTFENTVFITIETMPEKLEQPRAPIVQAESRPALPAQRPASNGARRDQPVCIPQRVLTLGECKSSDAAGPPVSAPSAPLSLAESLGRLGVRGDSPAI